MTVTNSALKFTHTNINLNINPQPYITILTNSKNRPFGKTIYFNQKTQKPDKKSGVMAGACQAETVKINDLTVDLPKILDNLKPSQAIIYGWVPGTEDQKPFFVYSRFNCKNIGGEDSVGIYSDNSGLRHARWTKNNFQFSSLIMFDIDNPDGLPKKLQTSNAQDWLMKMDSIYSNFSKLSRVIQYSSSSRIVDTSNNTHVFPSSSMHVIVQTDHTIPHPDDRNRWRHGLMVSAHNAGMTYMETFADGLRSKPLSIWDPVVLSSSQRISYDSKPLIEKDSRLSNLSVIDNKIEVYKGGYFDTFKIPTATPEDIEVMNSKFKTNLILGNSSVHQTEPTLTINQELETQYYGTQTVLDLVIMTKSMKDTKIRCQANWRGSSSWNAYFDLHKDGEPLVYDQGRDIKYVLSTIETNKLKTILVNQRINLLTNENKEETASSNVISIKKDNESKKIIIDSTSTTDKKVQDSKVEASVNSNSTLNQNSVSLPNMSKEWYEEQTVVLLTEALKLNPIELEKVINKIAEETGATKRSVQSLAREIEYNLITEAKQQVGETFGKKIKSIHDIDKVKDQKIKNDKYKAEKQKEKEKLVHRLKEQYCFDKSSNKFYDMITHIAMVPQAFNQAEEEAIDVVNGKTQTISASQLFKQQGGEVVDGITWEPNKYGAEPKQFINIGSKRYCNAYWHVHQNTIFESSDLVPIKPFIDHIKYIMPDPKDASVFLNCMAHDIQCVSSKRQWHILLHGSTRIGKDLSLQPLAWYFGNLYIDIDPDDKEGTKWGDAFAKRKVIVYQEVHRPGDRGFSNGLKTKLASTGSSMLTFNMKGGSLITHRNLMSVYMMSNFEDPIHLDADDGRVFVINAMNIKQKEESYYIKFINWLNYGEFELTISGEYEKNGPHSGNHRVIQWLMARNLSAFNPGKIPYHTAAKQAVINSSYSDVILYAKDKLEHAEGVFNSNMPVLTIDMLAEYLKKKLNKSVNTKILNIEMNVLQDAGLMRIEKRARIKANKALNRKEQARTVWRNPNYSGPEVDDDFDSPSALWDMYLKAREEMKSVIGAAVLGI